MTEGQKVWTLRRIVAGRFRLLKWIAECKQLVRGNDGKLHSRVLFQQRYATALFPVAKRKRCEKRLARAAKFEG